MENQKQSELGKCNFTAIHNSREIGKSQLSMFKDIVYIVSQCYKKNVAAYVSLGVLKQI